MISPDFLQGLCKLSLKSTGSELFLYFHHINDSFGLSDIIVDILLFAFVFWLFFPVYLLILMNLVYFILADISFLHQLLGSQTFCCLCRDIYVVLLSKRCSCFLE